MDNLEQGKNTGVILEVRPTDYVAGSSTGLPYEVRIESGDWEAYKPTDEWQRFKKGNNLGYDTNSCVTFSALNCVEIQVYYLIKNKLLSDDKIQSLKDLGYIDENGRPNFNDWFTAVMSGTTDNGNSIQNVWDSIRKDGLLPQKEGYTPNDFNTRTDYLSSKPTQDQKDKAKKILDIIDIKYEWINKSDVAKHLKQAPLHILTPTCGSWNTKPPTIISDCGVLTVNHATTNIGQVDGKYHKDLDHYEPFIKYLDWNYFIPYSVKGLVTPKTKFTFTKDLYMGITDTEVKELQKWLNNNGYPIAVSGAGSKGNETNYFWTLTKNALIKFQKANNIVPAEGYFGRLTRAKIATL